MPKPEILDPQGKAVTGALGRLGFAGMSVRQGKRFEIELDGEITEELLAEVRRAAETLLANTVIETFNVRVEPAPESPDEADGEAADAAEPADEPEQEGNAQEGQGQEGQGQEGQGESTEQAELATRAG